MNKKEKENRLVKGMAYAGKVGKVLRQHNSEEYRVKRRKEAIEELDKRNVAELLKNKWTPPFDIEMPCSICGFKKDLIWGSRTDEKPHYFCKDCERMLKKSATGESNENEDTDKGLKRYMDKEESENE